MAIGDYIHVVTVGESADGGAGSKPILNSYYFHRVGGPGSPSKSQINTAFQTAIQGPVLAALSVAYGQLINQIRFIDDANDGFQDFTQSHPGIITGERLPDSSAVVVRMKTAVRGKWAQGSKHYGPIAEDDTDGDILETAAAARFATIGTALVSGFTDAGGNVWKSTIVSIGSVLHASQLSVNPTTVNANDVTKMLVNQTLGTMRHRKPKTIAA